MLRAHRNLVLYCTLLKQAQEGEEREKIEEEMRTKPELHAILAQLQETGTGDIVEVRKMSKRKMKRRSFQTERQKRERAAQRKAAEAAGEDVSEHCETVFQVFHKRTTNLKFSIKVK